jgi:DNA-binding NarL/FixJ family response regulator
VGVSATGSSARDERIGVLLAIFDFPLLSAGYRTVIDAEPEMRVVGEVAGCEALPERILAPAADVVIVECRAYADERAIPFQALESLKALNPAIRLLALETSCGGDLFSLALRSGADGFLDRSAERSDVVAAIRSVSRGQTYVIPDVVTRMIDTYVLGGQEPRVEDVYDSLTDQDREILRLAAVGRTNREIARVLQVSEQTVHNHRATVMEKLGFHDRVELLKYAIKRGVVEVADL